MRTPTRHTSDALRRLRTGVTLAAWAIIIALALQMLTWALVNFTGLRHGQMPVIMPDTAAGAPAPPASLSTYDAWFQKQHHFAIGVGYVGLAVLLMQMSLAIVVAAASKSTGAGRITIAQSWTVLLCVLAVPWHLLVDHFPYRGLFTSYDLLCAQVEAYLSGGAGAPGPVVFYAQYFFLPLLSLIGTLYVWMQFRSGAAAEILPWGLNPEDIALERETAGRKAGSLHGSGRTGGALHQLVGGPASGKRNLENAPLENARKAPQPEAPPPTLLIDEDEREDDEPARRAI